MIGLLKSAEQYVEVKSFLKDINEIRRQVQENPATFSAFLNGKTPDVNSVMDMCKIMSQLKAGGKAKRQEELFNKYLANLDACDAITNNKSSSRKLPTYKEVDNSYFCFRQELTDASKKGPSSFVFTDSSYASTVDAEKKKCLDQQKTVANKKIEKKTARGALRKHRFLRLLLFIPVVLAMAATAFAAYAGISWLAVQTLSLSPLVLVAAALPAYLGYRLSKFLIRSPLGKLNDKIAQDKSVYQAKKAEYKQEVAKQNQLDKSFGELQKECDKNLAVKYPFEKDFNMNEAQNAFAERVKQMKEPNQTDEKQEVPAYSFAEDAKPVMEEKEKEKEKQPKQTISENEIVEATEQKPSNEDLARKNAEELDENVAKFSGKGKRTQDLNEEENAIFYRARNAKKTTRSKSATVTEYNISTGFEAVLGYLYLTGQQDRLNYLLNRGE